MSISTVSANRNPKALHHLVPGTIAGRTVLSAAVHGLALLLITNWWWLTAHPMHPAGLDTGSRIVLHYEPGRLAEPSQEVRHTVQRQHALRQTLRHQLPAPAPRTADAASLAVPDLQLEAGDDARGDGSASLRYVQSFPDQRPDFSAIGSTGDVIVDLQIDDAGRVQRAFARKGMAPAIDAMVIATVQRWIFDPARKDGRPVVSMQELHFHYDRSWSTGNCGWECIGLMSQ